MAADTGQDNKATGGLRGAVIREGIDAVTMVVKSPEDI